VDDELLKVLVSSGLELWQGLVVLTVGLIGALAVCRTRRR
jgi:hypothetical protein